MFFSGDSPLHSRLGLFLRVKVPLRVKFAFAILLFIFHRMLYNNFLPQDLKITSKIDNPVSVVTVGPKLTQLAQGNGDVSMTFKNAFFYKNIIFPITGSILKCFTVL